MTTPSAALVADLARVAGRHPGARRRRQDGADARPPGEARGAGQARRSASRASRSRGLRERWRARRRDASRATCSTATRSRACRRSPNVVFMAGHEVRLDRRRAPHLGDERARAGARRRGVRGARASSRSRPAASIRSCRSTAAARPRTRPPTPPPGEYANSCVGRERMFEHFSRRARHAGPADPAQLRDRHALRRAARRGAQGAATASRSTSPWATST